MLSFSKANAKTQALANDAEIGQFLNGKRKVFSLDLLSGFSCPFANECLSKAMVSESGRRIQDGPNTKFRCFSASQEVAYPNVYNSRSRNFNQLRGLSQEAMVELIESSMPQNLGVCRIHVAGDFFNESYLLAWAAVARNNPDRLFYAYTKSLKYWQNNRRFLSRIKNFVLTASFGGRLDKMIGKHRLRYSKVVFSQAEADRLGLAIDHDDSHAARPSNRRNNFALLIHGIQPKGSEAAQALKALKGEGSYSR
jgi:hypothetical protein